MPDTGSVQSKPVKRLLVVMPTWLGDCAMAMPTLRALRECYADARITALVSRAVRPVLDDCPWIDRVITTRKRRKGKPDRRRGPVALARRLSLGGFDMAVLLPNSFRWAMIVTMAGIHRRVGYDRDGRGFMLTDRLLPRRKPGGGFLPVPTRDYYLGIVRYLGVPDPDPTMLLFTNPADEAAAEALLRRAGFDTATGRPLVLLNVGANKPEKRWPADRFAQLASRLTSEFGATIALTGAPRERDVLDGVLRAATSPMIDLTRFGLDLSLLKAITKRANLLVTNDTGPRHIAAAFGTPVVTLFGPTPPEWTEIGFVDERQIVAKSACPVCRGHLERCMHVIDVEQVYAAAAELLRGPGSARPATLPVAGASAGH